MQHLTPAMSTMSIKAMITGLLCLLLLQPAKAQTPAARIFTKADTLRGTITPERAWWDVMRYDITVTPDYNNKTISGTSTITYKVVKDNNRLPMQLDLQEPMEIDSILLNNTARLSFTREGNAWHVQAPAQKKATEGKLTVFYHGQVKVAVRPPWSAGWTFTKDSLGRPWMTVTCQGGGASVWYPCKDHQSDEPDHGASLSITVPDTLVAVANGRLQSKKENGNGSTTYKWAVVNPISTYCIIPYIGKYVNFSETYAGEKGPLDVNYWVLDYNLDKARDYMPEQVHNMLKSLEFWFGPYPFYEDGYKLVETSHSGMEHQSAVSYGNKYHFGYNGKDGSGTGWGMKWDFIIIHESGHEWFGNNITSKDLADMYIHEGFTNYSETLFIDYIFGKDAANEYNAGIRRGIHNDRPIIPPYNVNAQGSGDMYPKASNMLHAIRHGIDNDTLFRQMLRGMNKTFYHQTVTTQQIENYISQNAHYNYNKVFDQYLRTIQIPRLELSFDKAHKEVSYRWANCVGGFNMPLVLKNEQAKLKVVPTEHWQKQLLKANEAPLFDTAAITKMYYVTTAIVEKK
ncbi:M1 family metallopeptidase [Chitinophaga agrisoli]|nr:M1 family metallopeptidase [Chitinophaga agrisoli]